jgi:hypothetical protein
MKRALGAAVVLGLIACSSPDSSPAPGTSDASSEAAPGPISRPDASRPPVLDDGGVPAAWDASIPPECETYADKALACCTSTASCSGVTRDGFLGYCTYFYTACTKYYACYLAASSCSAADACPTAGSGGCS